MAPCDMLWQICSEAAAGMWAFVAKTQLALM